ncbi:MAG TPA: DUF4331 family protein [Pirellulaceae bacterium]|jgi:hypothetical protein|nr:DUF4331 family protein [Pirellulaceae bacterium]
MAFSARELLISAGFVAVATLSLPASLVRGADHLDSPSVEADGRLDINDIYLFPALRNPNRTVFVMTVNPNAGILSPTSFNTAGVYEFNIDRDLDAVADLTFSITFKKGRGEEQIVTVRSSEEGELGSGPAGKNVNLRGGGKLRADVFDDPFFFDLNGFENDLKFTGTDFFAGFLTSAIILEVPTSSLGATQFGLWGRTTIRGDQFDRMGRPAITTATLKSDADKNAFNDSLPPNDFARFGEAVTNRIAEYNGGNRRLANDLACLLLPDLLTYDAEKPAAFPNGRALPTDVIDIELTLLSNGGLTTDGVDSNDRAFPGKFPYLVKTRELYVDRRPLADQLKTLPLQAYLSVDAAYQADTSNAFAAYASAYAYYAYLYALEAEKVQVRYFSGQDVVQYANLRYQAAILEFYAYFFIEVYINQPSGGSAPGSAQASEDALAAYRVQVRDLRSLTGDGD